MRASSEDSDDDLFLAAVEGATPLGDRDRVSAEQPPPSVILAPTANTPFTVEKREERVEGRSQGVSRKQLAALRAGDVRPAATLDLHRVVADDAARKLERFITDAVSAGHQCVLVIHGRGLHSSEGPVLRDRVIHVLSTGRTGRRVWAFCSAAGRDGGVGAMYVMVKKS